MKTDNKTQWAALLLVCKHLGGELRNGFGYVGTFGGRHLINADGRLWSVDLVLEQVEAAWFGPADAIDQLDAAIRKCATTRPSSARVHKLEGVIAELRQIRPR